ncbi:flagellar protein FliT [Leeia aquatica]|uniref:Flagellar protein FliT n=1 Tax=Leeia aquatica TaxID=2725557 RepID=A0A847S696_9NEIS|nr:flagellar protein FliT [Leeia aquatica]NLR74587.1 flagellar protein FliT [Leeia aquatica]
MTESIPLTLEQLESLVSRLLEAARGEDWESVHELLPQLVTPLVDDTTAPAVQQRIQSLQQALSQLEPVLRARMRTLQDDLGAVSVAQRVNKAYSPG